MKLFKYIIPSVILLAAASLSSCEDMMETNSDSYLFEEDNSLSTASDSLYSVMGILTQVQKVAERYVLFGELRGDLMQATPDAPFSLQEISNFEVTPENTYLSRRDFYSIINNCNYAIEKMDTSIVIGSNKVMMPEYVAIRTIRAWTYFQLGLAFGKVSYFTEPILSVDESLDNMPQIELDNLVNELIADLEPYFGIETPYQYGSVDGYDTRQFFIQPKLLLADLLLYNNNYELAAALYYDYINRNNLTMPISYANVWSSANRDGMNYGAQSAYHNEVISRIPFSSDGKQYHPNLVNLTYNTVPAIVPSQKFVNEMAAAVHYYNNNINNQANIVGIFEGDTRGGLPFANGKGYSSSAFTAMNLSGNTNTDIIAKYYHNAIENSAMSNPDNEMFDDIVPRVVRSVATYRIPTVYLRYAEAVNRSGRPTMAFAVIKYGLRQAISSVDVNTTRVEEGEAPYVNLDEIVDGPEWLNFDNNKFDSNWGSGMRGRGYSLYIPKSEYIIPQLETKADSIDWVENELLYEMAAETCFEGNRFFDLLRVSRHRDDHPALMVDKISSRFDNPAAAAAHISNPDSWWIK
ncbi:MAG: RagB/SusD family nutrient uptake outer membrane protein [Muribaculaceae bacterium]|nr:RagB/SusD family nutrient uptake outer membrane protein [Muribaculaceae bacterium]